MWYKYCSSNRSVTIGILFLRWREYKIQLAGMLYSINCKRNVKQDFWASWQIGFAAGNSLGYCAGIVLTTLTKQAALCYKQGQPGTMQPAENWK